MRSILSLFVCGFPVLSWAGVAAQTYPTKPLRMVVTFTAGGSSDAMARSVAKALADDIGQQVVIENRPGAGGNIGAEYVARAPAAGYTLLFGAIGPHAIGPPLTKNHSSHPVNARAPA